MATTLADRVARLRSLGVTAQDIASRAGTKRPSLLRWLRAQTEPVPTLESRILAAVESLEADFPPFASRDSDATCAISTEKPTP